MFLPLPQPDSRYDFYTCITLIDITKTTAVRAYNKAMPDTENDYTIKRNQRRNWETMAQVISLRCQPFHLTTPIKLEQQDLIELGFGSQFITGAIWAFSFGVEAEGIFDLPNRPVGALLDDLHNVPIITDLTETVDIDTELLNTISISTKNTIIIK